MMSHISRCSLRNSCMYSDFLGRIFQMKTTSELSTVSQRSVLPFGIGTLTNNTEIKNIRNDVRRYKSSQTGSSNRLPPLMDFPKIQWPSLVKSIRNFILATFIIKPYFDRDFNLPDFVLGSKKAVEVVSKKLAEGDIKALNGLVTSDILPTLQKAISLMSLSQREEIAVNIDDIYLSFPYQVGVLFNEENDQKRFVEITMVFHALKGLSQMREQGENINMGMLPEYQHRISVCNYRFIKEFTKGIESDWTINVLNHFKPIDEAHD